VNIPKVIYLFWGGTPLSYLRYLTVKTLSDLNPGWEIRVYTGNFCTPPGWKTGEQAQFYRGEDYLPRLQDLPNVVIHPVVRDDLQGFHPAIVSDILRWELLQKGGFWSDFDILYTAPLQTAISEFSRKDASIVAYHQKDSSPTATLPFYVFIGTIFSTGDLQARISFEWLRRQAMRSATNREYQSAGSSLLPALASQDFVHTEPPDAFYPVTGGGMVERLFHVRPRGFDMTRDRHGVHWFGGHPSTRRWENVITEKTIDQYRNLYVFRRVKI